MSRTDGKFPRYIKLDIDQDNWPDNYWSSSRFCRECGTHWPNTHLFETCLNCDISTSVDTYSPPEMRWPDAITSLLTYRFEKLYEIYNEGIDDKQLVEAETKKEVHNTLA